MRAIGSSLRCWAGLTLAPLCLLASPVERYGRLPLSFEPNQGQAPSGVQFLARGPGYLVGLSAGSSTLVLGSSRAVVRANLTGANASASGAGQDPLPGKAQYFIGNSPDGWRSGIPTFGRVRFREVYPGVDLVYYGTQRQLEYDFEVSPGANPGRIRISFDGVEKLRIASNGDLVLGLREGELRHHRPRAYQRGPGGSRPVNARYRIAGRSEVSIELADYDHSRALTIDPVLTYSTYLGGTGDDRAYGIAVDAAGCAYIVGETFSNNFPAANAWQPWLKGYSDVFVTKLNAAGTALVFSTYIGGSDRDAGSAIALDASGNIYIAGYTRSTNFPATYGVLRNTSAGGEDAFVAKLGPDGSYLAYSTYLGGSGNDRAQAIAVDASGNAYIAGYTGSVNFPLVSAVQNVYGGGTDGFVAKLNPYASGLVYSTYLGGSDNDTAAGIAVDSSGAAYITGQTQSANFPARNALQPGKAGGADAFVTKLTPAGNDFVFSTYLGGSGTDGATAIALDKERNVYLTGSTYSVNFPVTSGAYQSASRGAYDAFLTKVNPAGTQLLSSTYIGGSGSEEGQALAVDTSGNIFVAGYTESADFPTKSPAQSSFGGGRDAFLAVFYGTTNGLQYATLVGGSADDRAQGIAALNGSAYLAGYTLSPDMPASLGSFQSTLTGSVDAWVARVDGPAVMLSPTPGSTFGSGSVTFAWSSAVGATAYWLDVGNKAGVGDIYGANVGNVTTKTVDVPTDGRTVYVRLWSSIAGNWLFNDYTYQAMAGKPQAAMLTPAPGSALGGSTVTFTWTTGTNATQYWLDVGNSPGIGDIYGANQGSATSKTLANMPTDGRKVYVRLWSYIYGLWDYNDYTYLAGAQAVMLSPTPGSNLTSQVATFAWSAGTAATQYWLDVGNSRGSGDIYAGNQGSATSRSVAGLPTDGRTLYVRLWSYIGGVWLCYDYTYLSAVRASMVNPTPGSQLTGSAVTFTWSSGTAPSQYWLDVGNSQGSGDIYAANQGNATSRAVSGLPVDGRRLYVRLWSYFDGLWVNYDYTYTAASKAVMLSPTPGSPLTTSTVTFTWSAGVGPTEYWLDVGNSIGSGDIYAGNQGTATSKTVTSIPTDGRPLYVRLWSKISGVWVNNDYRYN